MQSEEPSPLRRLAIPALLVALAMLAINYKYVEASILQNLVAHKNEKSQHTLAYNSQTLPLLKAGGHQATAPFLLEEGVLAAETGPLGVVYDSTPGGTISRYTVKAGDTLESVAKAHGISKNTIIWANAIGKNPTLSVGQELVILPVSGVRYTVKESGETVSSIAQKFKADAAEIADYNDVVLSNTFSKGTQLIIPDGELAIEQPKQAEKEEKKDKKTLPAPKAKVAIAVPKIVAQTETPPAVNETAKKNTTGYFIRPLKAGVLTQGLHGFNGVDFGVPIGTPVYAAAAGKVIVVKGANAWNGGYGNYVVIEHDNGTQTLYAHNDKNMVSVGDVVTQGHTIALSGNTGRSTGPHLHFEVRGGTNPFGKK